MFHTCLEIVLPSPVRSWSNVKTPPTRRNQLQSTLPVGEQTGNLHAAFEKGPTLGRSTLGEPVVRLIAGIGIGPRQLDFRRIENRGIEFREPKKLACRRNLLGSKAQPTGDLSVKGPHAGQLFVGSS